MLNYVHTFVGSAPLAGPKKAPESGPGHGPRSADSQLPTPDSDRSLPESIWVGVATGRGWFACAVFMLANHLISFRFMPLLPRAVLLRFSSEIYYILITPRGLVVAVKAYF